MGKADRFTDKELEYIRAVYPRLGPTEISRRLGRSLSAVKARIKQMNLPKEIPIAEISPDDITVTEPQDTYERLIELREILRREMVAAPSNCIAGMCKEYRAVMADIEKLENAGASQNENPLEQLAKAISDGLRA